MKKHIIIPLVLIGVILGVLLLIIVLFPKKYSNHIELYANKYNLNKSLVYSVINIESGFDKNSVSSAGAVGLMQIMPDTASECAYKLGIDDGDVFEESFNIEIGCYYLRYLLDIFDGNIVNTLCAYNWGLGNVWDWINKGNVDEGGTITNLQVAETKNYIVKFRVNQFVYKNILGVDK